MDWLVQTDNLPEQWLQAMTGALSVILHRVVGPLLLEEQKAEVQGRRSCLDAMVMDVALAKEARMYK